MARENEPGMPNTKKSKNGTGRWTKYEPSKLATKVTWGDVDQLSIVAAIQEVVDSGAAIIFGATRDGGALALTVCDGDERLKLYSPTAEGMNKHLHDVIKA